MAARLRKAIRRWRIAFGTVDERDEQRGGRQTDTQRHQGGLVIEPAEGHSEQRRHAGQDDAEGASDPEDGRKLCLRDTDPCG